MFLETLLDLFYLSISLYSKYFKANKGVRKHISIKQHVILSSDEGLHPDDGDVEDGEEGDRPGHHVEVASVALEPFQFVVKQVRDETEV